MKVLTLPLPTPRLPKAKHLSRHTILNLRGMRLLAYRLSVLSQNLLLAVAAVTTGEAERTQKALGKTRPHSLALGTPG